MKIGNWDSASGHCYVIAEAGSNHDRKLEQALALVDVAADAGADAVKFQLFKAARLYPQTDTRVAYLAELGIDRPVYELVRQLELPDEWLPALANQARRRMIDFLVTPFDEGAVAALKPFVPAYKIASYELTHIPLIMAAARTSKPILLSTGGATHDAALLEQIHQAAGAREAHAELALQHRGRSEL